MPISAVLFDLDDTLFDHRNSARAALSARKISSIFFAIVGRNVDVIAQASKQGFVYVFDRRTGEAVWPIEERPVPQSDVPGEKTSPTQPFPTKPHSSLRRSADARTSSPRKSVSPTYELPLSTRPPSSGASRGCCSCSTPGRRAATS